LQSKLQIAGLEKLGLNKELLSSVTKGVRSPMGTLETLFESNKVLGVGKPPRSGGQNQNTDSV